MESCIKYCIEHLKTIIAWKTVVTSTTQKHYHWRKLKSQKLGTRDAHACRELELPLHTGIRLDTWETVDAPSLWRGSRPGWLWPQAAWSNNPAHSRGWGLGGLWSPLQSKPLWLTVKFVFAFPWDPLELISIHPHTQRGSVPVRSIYPRTTEDGQLSASQSSRLYISEQKSLFSWLQLTWTGFWIRPSQRTIQKPLWGNIVTFTSGQESTASFCWPPTNGEQSICYCVTWEIPTSSSQCSFSKELRCHISAGSILRFWNASIIHTWRCWDFRGQLRGPVLHISIHWNVLHSVFAF